MNFCGQIMSTVFNVREGVGSERGYQKAFQKPNLSQYSGGGTEKRSKNWI